MKRKTLSETLNTRVDKQTAKLIGNAARREGLPESQIVRRALRYYFATLSGNVLPSLTEDPQ